MGSAFKYLIILILIVLVCASSVSLMATEAGALSIEVSTSSLTGSKQFPFGPSRPTATTTVTNMFIFTQTTQLRVTCAKLVNVTGACRRRRGMWEEVPIIISFDDNVDQSVQFLYTPVLDFMETTALAENSSFGTSALPGGGGVGMNSEEVIISSQEDEHRQNFPVIQQVAGYVESFLQQFKPTTTTITKTISITETVNTRTTSTATFYIQRCTPFPFRFSVCRNRRR